MSCNANEWFFCLGNLLSHQIDNHYTQHRFRTKFYLGINCNTKRQNTSSFDKVKLSKDPSLPFHVNKRPSRPAEGLWADKFKITVDKIWPKSMYLDTCNLTNEENGILKIHYIKSICWMMQDEVNFSLGNSTGSGVCSV